MPLEKENLDETKEDKFLKITKSSVTTACKFIPFIGTGIAEVINYFIPDNRRERVLNFIKELSDCVVSQKKANNGVAAMAEKNKDR